jgi:hypothetical protein
MESTEVDPLGSNAHFTNQTSLCSSGREVLPISHVRAGQGSIIAVAGSSTGASEWSATTELAPQR